MTGYPELVPALFVRVSDLRNVVPVTIDLPHVDPDLRKSASALAIS